MTGKVRERTNFAGWVQGHVLGARSPVSVSTGLRLGFVDERAKVAPTMRWSIWPKGLRRMQSARSIATRRGVAGYPLAGIAPT